MLELQHVSKTFNPGTINEKKALSDLSLHLAPGDFVTVIGGNGAGKSTLLNAVAGVWPVDSGRILLDGEDITALPEHRRAVHIGRVFQDPMMGTAPNMQLEENLALALRRGQKRGLKWGVTKLEREDYRALLADLGLGLEDRLTAKVGLLSGGQRQAVTLLMAALRRPKLLLLDEHTAALDPATAAKVLELSDRIVSEAHLTALMITHNMSDAIRHGNRLIMMDEGHIILDISGEAKKKLTKRELIDRFAQSGGEIQPRELLDDPQEKQQHQQRDHAGRHDHYGKRLDKAVDGVHGLVGQRGGRLGKTVEDRLDDALVLRRVGKRGRLVRERLGRADRAVDRFAVSAVDKIRDLKAQRDQQIKREAHCREPERKTAEQHRMAIERDDGEHAGAGDQDPEDARADDRDQKLFGIEHRQDQQKIF